MKFQKDDFAWLVPGSRLASKQDGYFRVKRVDLQHEQAVLRNGSGEDSLVNLDELIRYFWHRD